VQKGSDSIDDLNEKLNDLMSAITNKFEDVKEGTMELFENEKNKVEASK
jgi:hypothetical protein